MKLISFDIGIKNMAYCIFDLSSENIDLSNININDWNILNMIETSNDELKYCTMRNKPKNKKSDTIICNKKAKYCIHHEYYCEKHALMNNNYILPNKKYSNTSLKKNKNEELLKICQEFKILSEEEITTNHLLKKDILNKIMIFFENNSYKLLNSNKKVSANDVDLISIGKKMKILLNNINEINDITHVIIENQISPIANRMKTIQGMLSQYFIMKNDNIQIFFISSSNKLKDNKLILQNTNDKTNDITNINDKYKENKKNGILLCSQILEENENFHQWKHILLSKKKDDLSDCFLQGLWFIKNRINK